MIDNKKYNIFVIVALIFTFVGFLTIDKDLPNNYSSSRAPYLDESLKNYIVKNIPSSNNEQVHVYVEGFDKKDEVYLVEYKE